MMKETQQTAGGFYSLCNFLQRPFARLKGLWRDGAWLVVVPSNSLGTILGTLPGTSSSVLSQDLRLLNGTILFASFFGGILFAFSFAKILKEIERGQRNILGLTDSSMTKEKQSLGGLILQTLFSLTKYVCLFLVGACGTCILLFLSGMLYYFFVLK